MILIEGIIKCSKSFKMRANYLLFLLAYMRIFKIIIKYFVSQYEITLDDEPYTVAMPNVKSSLNLRIDSLHDEILIR